MGSKQLGVKLLNGFEILDLGRMAQKTGEGIETSSNMKMVRARHRKNGRKQQAGGGAFGSLLLL